MARRAYGPSQQLAAEAMGIWVPSAQRIDRVELQPEGQQLERTIPGQEWFRRKRILQRCVELWKAIHGRPGT